MENPRDEAYREMADEPVDKLLGRLAACETAFATVLFLARKQASPGDVPEALSDFLEDSQEVPEFLDEGLFREGSDAHAGLLRAILLEFDIQFPFTGRAGQSFH